MAHILFATVPQMGHINPTMPLAVELKKRGHRVSYATGADYRSGIEAEGLGFYPAGPPGWHSHVSRLSKKMLRHRGMLGNYYGVKVLAEHAMETVKDLCAVVERCRPDVMAVDSITHAGAFVAEAFGLPWATCCPIPGFIPTRDAPPFTTWGLPPSKRLPVRALYTVIRAGQETFLSLFDRDFNRVRLSLGLKPARRCVLEGPLSPYLILVFTCEGLEYPRNDWPAQAHLVGPSGWGKAVDGNEAHEWIEQLPKDKPLIYVTLGTVQIFRSLRFFDLVRQALAGEPYRVVMAVGRDVDLGALGPFPENFRIEHFVPHAKILPRATAVIHHGGQGIAQDTVYHGLPSVVVPVTQDLHEMARRCSSAGVSLRIPYRKLTPERLRAAVREILSSAAIRQSTKQLQAVCRGTDAGAAGATLIETLARTRRPVLKAG